MICFPYSLDRYDATATFAQMDADAQMLEALARECEASARMIEDFPSGSAAAAKSLRIKAKRLQRAAACLAYVAGRVDRLHLLSEPVRRQTHYGAPRR